MKNNIFHDFSQELKDIKYALDQSSIVVFTDVNGIITDVNDKFVEESKYSRKELIGQTHSLINSGFHPKEFFQKLWNTILSGKVWHGEVRNKSRDGKFFWADTTITPLFNEKGKIKGFLAIRNDITAKKMLDQKKDEFISVASHELKTPLTSIKAYGEIIRDRFKKYDDLLLNKYLKRMNQQINILGDYVDDLLNVNKIQSGKLVLRKEKFDLGELITEIKENTEETNSEYKVITHISEIKVTADRGKIGQVISNLVSNAIKYSLPVKEIVITSEIKDQEAVISVRDFGIGIPKKLQSKIFDRYFQVEGLDRNKYGGLGLGLYISEGIVKLHGGRIWLESEEGRGSTFYFSLPII
ncbi:MAG: PAS/PAC sensor signal transduction histidine kinase [Candidatus Gottesmanbacteria bacterium GW2011_GWC2_39_8]|uniref:histidine kinase n=1 Tax=Candidatus Gottesmanbacteria bacterium GW2011_GWC2_39_8 TaxID=1618450 RepID=A0A0G0SI60_9BACT|nr:MAG: PAS/PAC sensor signal transduction histidine kinase [Candidatus Gottesmanbacteria bacterium GW2011_GWC2_39_8]